MAISWLTVLKSVPWTEVIRNAPKVADSAKKLWSNVGKQPAAPHPAAAMEARLAALEVAAGELQKQMVDSSEVIKALAEQNAELIARIEANRVRLAWVTGIALASGLIAVVALVLFLRTT